MTYRLPVVLLGFSIALFACTPDQFRSPPSAHLMPIGSVFQDRIQVGRSTIPLPPGDWILAAARDGRSQMVDGAMRTPLAQIQLYKLSQGNAARDVEGMIMVTANIDTQSVYWLRDRECESSNSLYVKNEWNGDQDQKCMYIRSYTTNWRYGQDWSDLTKAGIDWLASQKVLLTPTNFLFTYYRYVRYSDLVRVWYYTPSRSFGVPVSNDNDWHPISRRSRPDLEKVLSERIAWSEAFATQVRAGFEGKLEPVATRPSVSAPSLPTPAATSGSPAAPDRATRLRELMDLRQKNLISEEEYQRLRQRALEGL